METKNIVKAKLIACEMEDRQGTPRMAGAIKVNNKDYRFTAAESYDSKKVEVSVQSFFNNEELKNLGIEIDYSEIINDFKAKVKVIKAEADAKRKAEREKFYDESPMHKLIKLLPKTPGKAHLSHTKEEYVKGESFRTSLSICFKEVHQGTITEYYITHDPVYSNSMWRSSVKGHRFNINVSGQYDREFKKWSTTPEKTAVKFNELREMMNRRIDAKIEHAKESNKELNVMKERFGDDVQQQIEKDYKRGYTTTTYFKGKIVKDDVAGVNFSPDDKGYRIRKITGNFSSAQLKAIIAIVNEAKPVYKYH